MIETSIPIQVECHAGYRGEETPRWLILGKQRLAVKKIIDRWLAPDHRYFKLIGEDGALYLIRHDIASSRWELTMYDQRGVGPHPG